jgi:hypothetical protein
VLKGLWTEESAFNAVRSWLKLNVVEDQWNGVLPYDHCHHQLRPHLCGPQKISFSKVFAGHAVGRHQRSSRRYPVHSVTHVSGLDPGWLVGAVGIEPKTTIDDA